MLTKEFRKTVDDQAKFAPKDTDLIGILDDLEVSLRDVEGKAKSIGLASDEIDGVRTRLIVEAERKWISTKYPLLDLSFTNRRRDVVYGWNDKDDVELKNGSEEGCCAGTLPVFTHVWGSVSDFENYFGHNEDNHSSMEYDEFLGEIPRCKKHPRRRVHATAKLPSGMSMALITKARRAICLANLFDVILFDRGLDRYDTRHNYNWQVGVLWAPTDEAWSLSHRTVRMKGDPAVMIGRDRANTDHYLVGYYDTPDEKPIDHIIREFTSGKVGKRLPKRK